MKNLLFVSSSPRGKASYSYQTAQKIVDDLKASHPDLRIAVRDVAKDALPHASEAFVGGLFTAPEQRAPHQAEAIALSDKLVAEVEAADTLVIAAPMYNFGLPSMLKAWIDHIVRAGKTFTYTATGPVGLLKNKKAIIVVSRGGVYSEGPMKAFDFQEAYLRTILGFIGITDVEIVRIEGVAMGDEAVKNALSSAKSQSEAVLRAVA